MIAGIGTDLVDIRRIEKAIKKSGDVFLKKILNESEIKESKKYNARKFHAYVAKRFAAKEAFAKALGTGIGKQIAFKDITVSSRKSGQPEISLNTKGKKAVVKICDGKKPQIHLSLSDEYPFAQAFVVISVL